MATYFAFSDESGEYRASATARFYRRQPYYARSVVLVDVESWRTLKDEFYDLKDQNRLPRDKEVKWSYLWLLKELRKKNEYIPPDAPYYFLQKFPDDVLLAFVSNSCQLLCKCSYCKIIFTVTFNDMRYSTAKAYIYKWHLQELMQRIEMEMESNADNLAILFFDSINHNTDKLIRNAYNDIYLTGDFIKEYSHIKDSISFELSHHSFGVQMADYAAGIFRDFLVGYEQSKNLFNQHLYKLVRKDPNTGEILGWGIREVPRDDYIRSRLEEMLPK